MKIIRVLGGLGNQMFQYAFYKAMEKQFPDVRVDLSEFKNYKLHNNYELKKIFNIEVVQSNQYYNLIYGGNNRDILSRAVKKIIGLRSTYYEQKNSSFFDSSLFLKEKNMYLDGYWQNEEYFKGICQVIAKDFTFPEITDVRNAEVLMEIRNRNSVSIHIRRGDYLEHPLLDGCCTLQYYREAIDYLKSRYNNLSFFVFSNDINWCKNELFIDSSTSYIDWNIKSSSYIDMQLMSYCKFNIIANSSFSWWGAYLNQYSLKEVIAPKYWFRPHDDETLKISNDLIPQKWIRI